MSIYDIVGLVVIGAVYLFGAGAMWHAVIDHDSDELLAMYAAVAWPVAAVFWGGARFARWILS